MITRWLLIGGLLAVIALAGQALRLSSQLRAIELKQAETQGALTKCQGRIHNIQEDKQSDETVDDPDFTVPDRWLFPNAD